MNAVLNSVFTYKNKKRISASRNFSLDKLFFFTCMLCLIHLDLDVCVFVLYICVYSEQSGIFSSVKACKVTKTESKQHNFTYSKTKGQKD